MIALEYLTLAVNASAALQLQYTAVGTSSDDIISLTLFFEGCICCQNLFIGGAVGITTVIHDWLDLDVLMVRSMMSVTAL